MVMCSMSRLHGSLLYCVLLLCVRGGRQSKGPLGRETANRLEGEEEDETGLGPFVSGSCHGYRGWMCRL